MTITYTPPTAAGQTGPPAPPVVEHVELTIDGRPVSVPRGTTLWEASRQAGIPIPALCHDPGMDPVAVCRVCAVEVQGSRVLPAACIRQCEAGMVVRTDSDRVRNSQKMVVELLMADHPSPCAKQRLSGGCDLENLAAELGASRPRLRNTRDWSDPGPVEGSRLKVEGAE